MGWLVGLVFLARAAVLGAPPLAAFVIVTALLSGDVESERLRLALGALAAVGVPLVLHWRLRELLRTRKKAMRAPSAGAFVALANCVMVAALAFGFADDVGRALRRHGDWFVGERNGSVARGVRYSVASLAGDLEKFDPPPDLAPVVIPADPAKPAVAPTVLAWFHPLAGPRRAMPMSEARRFGAQRPPPRPAECELGHCGVDLGTTLGEPVFAIFDGVIERIERNEENGGRAGRYVRIGHKEGSIVSRYIHLDSIRNDLKEGDRVAGGQLIGRVGKSGVMYSGPHLHFGLSRREGGRETYLDPEPLLREWRLPEANTAVAMK
jgi:hypothetical protein